MDFVEWCLLVLSLGFFFDGMVKMFPLCNQTNKQLQGRHHDDEILAPLQRIEFMIDPNHSCFSTRLSPVVLSCES